MPTKLFKLTVATIPFWRRVGRILAAAAEGRVQGASVIVEAVRVGFSPPLRTAIAAAQVRFSARVQTVVPVGWRGCREAVMRP